MPAAGLLAILSRLMTDKNEHGQHDRLDDPSKQEVKTLDQVLKKRPKEYGGPSGLEPTRYGDWERKGRCIDF